MFMPPYTVYVLIFNLNKLNLMKAIGNIKKPKNITAQFCKIIDYI